MRPGRIGVSRGVQQARTIAAGSIVVGLCVLALRTAAWWATGSAALFSDAAETVVNVVAGCLAFAALHLAAKPADENHPFGHDKAEFFAAVIEGALIVGASLAILQHALDAYRHPVTLTAPAVGMGLNAVGTLANAVWGTVLLQRGRALRSPALHADGRHLMSDVVASTGILLGVGLVVATGIVWLDAVIAALTAVYILGAGYGVLRESVGGLMDAAPSPEIVARVRGIVSEHAAGAIEAHDLRMRHAGRITFLEFHLVVPAAMTVADAHTICDRLEEVLRAEMEGLTTTIHVEPEGKAKHQGIIVL